MTHEENSETCVQEHYPESVKALLRAKPFPKTLIKNVVIHSKARESNANTSVYGDAYLIYEEWDSPQRIFEYEGKICTGILNPFVGNYYVDDLFGIIQE